MKIRPDFIDVIDRLKKSLKIKQDNEIAELLGMKANTFNARKKAESLPYDEIFALANSKNLDFNWLLTGSGNMYRDQQSEFDPEIQAVVTIMKELDAPEKTDIRVSAEKTKQFVQMRRQLSALTMRQSA